MALSENKKKMQAGELYLAFTPELTEERARCARAYHNYNTKAFGASRRDAVKLWKE